MPMSEDPFESEEWRAYAARVRGELVPKLRASECTVSLVPSGETDIKFAVELGLSIMMDKPIILIFEPGTKVPERLVRVADEILSGEFRGTAPSPDLAAQIHDALDRVLGPEVGAG